MGSDLAKEQECSEIHISLLFIRFIFFFEHTEVKYKKIRPSLRLEGRQHGSALLLHTGFTSPVGTLWHFDELPTDSEERLGLLVETNCINK